MLSVSEAQNKIIECKVYRKIDKVPILDSLDRVLAEKIVSKDCIPHYDNSAVDGYAVRSTDIIGADKNYPVKLKLMGNTTILKEIPDNKIEPGFCAKIVSGSPIPSGCDSVVIKEDTIREGRDVLIFKQCKPKENIRIKGEYISKGEAVIKKGKKITPGDIGIMSLLGLMDIKVFRPPTVGILVTGSELIPAGEKLEIAKIRDINSFILAAQIRDAGAYAKLFGIASDDKKVLKKKILSSLSNCDLLLLTGGISVGDYDFVREVLSDIGVEFLFWRINQDPGKPMAFLTYNKKYIFGLPGNPDSVIICFEMYVRLLIKKIMGEQELFRGSVFAKAGDKFDHIKGLTSFLPVKLECIEDSVYFKPAGKNFASIIESISVADGLAVFTEDKGIIEKDSEVEVYLL